MSEFSKGWKPLAAAVLGVACGASPIPFNVLPQIIGPIHAETGWSFVEISLGITLFGIIASFTAPFVGGLADRRGVRPVALISLLLFGLVFAAMWFVPAQLAAYWAFWAVLGVIGIGSTPVTWSRAVSMWFVTNRGLALGIMLIGTSLTAIVLPKVAQAAIAYGGWRLAFPALALLPLLVALPIASLWFREPRPDERPAPLTDGAGALAGDTLPQAMRDYRFWILFTSIALISLAYGGVFIHMTEIVKLHGFTAGQGASVMSVAGLGILSGRVIVGLLFDRFWAPAIATPALLLPAIACGILLGTGSSIGMLTMAGFLVGFAAGAESDVIAFLAARYFGMAHYGRIYGLLYMPFGIGSALSPILFARVRDVTKSYDLALMGAMGGFVLGAVILLALGRYPGDRKATEAMA
jgi:MFS transporter, OFA family, oxalate/formate antiporter